MPIYEYESLEPNKGCKKCAHRLEVIQGIAEEPLSYCPHCGQKLVKEWPLDKPEIKQKLETTERKSRILGKIIDLHGFDQSNI